MTIKIRNLRLETVLGVADSERSGPREVFVNVQIEYDAADATKSDSLVDALDYKDIHRVLAEVASNGQFKLIETLVDRMAAKLAHDQRVIRFSLEVDKPGALRMAESVSVATSWKRRNPAQVQPAARRPA
jgi:FolB domain-containing protein